MGNRGQEGQAQDVRGVGEVVVLGARVAEFGVQSQVGAAAVERQDFAAELLVDEQEVGA